MDKMTNEEDKFWLDVAGHLNPEWEVGRYDADTTRTALAHHDVFVYMVDTSTMWMVAGSTTSSEMFRARRAVSAAELGPGTVAGAAGEVILKCGERGLADDHGDVKTAFTSAVCAITDSATWTAVMDRTGNPAGHWIWMVYRLANGDALGRPMYAQDDRRGFMPLAQLKDSLGAALENDIGNRASTVARKILVGGGAKLSGELEARFPGLFGASDSSGPA